MVQDDSLVPGLPCGRQVAPLTELGNSRKSLGEGKVKRRSFLHELGSSCLHSGVSQRELARAQGLLSARPAPDDKEPSQVNGNTRRQEGLG